jgi:hypothetical protein
MQQLRGIAPLSKTHLFKLIGLTACGLASAAAPVFGAGVSPFVGTWILNRDKSDFHGDPGYKSQTMTVTDVGAGVLHYSFDLVDSAGKSSHVEYDTKADGKSYPIANSEAFDSNKSQLLGSRKVKWTVLKNSAAVAWGVDEVSKDGKTKAEIEHWRHDGKLYTYRLVFDLQ